MTAATTSRKTSAVRGAILESALRHFSARGYSGTTMRDIARDVDCSTSTIYQHFASKYHILMTIIDEVMSELEVSLTEALAASGEQTPAELLRSAVRMHILVHTAKLQRESLIAASEMRSLDDADRTAYIERRDKYEGIFRDIVSDGINDGSFVVAYPKKAVQAILVMSTGVASWYRSDGETSPGDLADIYAVLALQMLGYR